MLKSLGCNDQNPIWPIDPTIRYATIEDAPEAAACLAELGYGTTAVVVADSIGRCAADSGAVLVADDPGQGRVLGVAGIHLVPLLHAAGALARLTALAVRADCQRQGVGRALVTAAEAFARQAGCRRLEVTSGDHRPAAHAFYERVGFRSDERRFIKPISAPQAEGVVDG